LLLGITVGALTKFVAQNMSNKEETAKTAEQLFAPKFGNFIANRVYGRKPII
jgi:hypothetical protein